MYSYICLAVVLFAACEGALRRDTWQTTVNGVPVPHERAGELIFEDNFDDIDYSVWQHEKTASGGGNWEFQIYQNNRSNSYVRDGNLYIQPTLTEDQYGEGFCNSGTLDLHGGAPADECTNPGWGGCVRFSNGGATTINPTISARLRTTNSFAFKYGTLEVRAKMPRGDWLWPAIWMLPRDNGYGGWPASGEIDLVESRGNRDLVINGDQIGEQRAGSTLHYGPFYPMNGYEYASSHQNRPEGFGSSFVTYKVEWTPEYIKFFYDDVEIGTVDPGDEGFWSFYPFEDMAPGIDNPWEGPNQTKMTPFDKEYYILLNVAVGGTNSFFPDEAVNGAYPKPWSNSAPNAMGDFLNAINSWYPTWEGDDAAMVVDYVRVYAL